MKKVSINIPSPFSVLTWGLMLYLFIFFISPLTPTYTGTVYSWSYLLVSISALYLGLLFGYKKLTFQARKIQITINIKVLKKVFKIILMVAIVGVLLRIIDKYYFRGATLALDIVENREALSAQSSGLISIISAILYPFSFIILFYYLFLKRIEAISTVWLSLVLPVSLFPIIDGLFFGSRSSALVFVALTVFYFGAFNFFKLKLNIKTLIIGITFLGIMFSLSGYLFSFRTESLGMDPILSTQISGYAHFVKLDMEWTNFLYSMQGNFIYYFYIGMINFVQYFIHGVFELLYMVDVFDTEHITYGGQNFFIIMKFFSKIIHFDLDFINNAQIRAGIYTTFFGPVYYDFAYIGVFFSFLFSFTIGRIASNIIKKGNITLLPLYFYLLIILFFSLVVSLLVYAQGMYLIIASLLSHLIAKRFLNKDTLAFCT
ncbi:O-antigen polymerase [Sulfurovum sp.]|uniref:O-antigen polymerase n=1 Tax=Sulfurovum sp. TaxID=1969726 RepID=UPI0035629540